MEKTEIKWKSRNNNPPTTWHIRSVSTKRRKKLQKHEVATWGTTWWPTMHYHPPPISHTVSPTQHTMSGMCCRIRLLNGNGCFCCCCCCKPAEVWWFEVFSCFSGGRNNNENKKKECMWKKSKTVWQSFCFCCSKLLTCMLQRSRNEWVWNSGA